MFLSKIASTIDFNWSPNFLCLPASPCCLWRESGGTTSENLVEAAHSMDSCLFVQLFFWDFVGIFKNHLDLIWIILDVPKSEKLQHPSSSIQVGLYYRYGVFFQFRAGNPWMGFERHRRTAIPISRESYGSHDFCPQGIMEGPDIQCNLVIPSGKLT